MHRLTVSATRWKPKLKVYATISIRNGIRCCYSDTKHLDPTSHEADWQAWDKQLDDDVKTGKLDATLERISKDFHAGKCEDLAVFLSQNATEK